MASIARTTKPRRDLWTVAGLTTAILLPYAFYFIRLGYNLAFADGQSKLLIARRVFSNTVGHISMAQLGGEWLTLYQVLMLSTVWNSTMFRTGLAGTVVSLPAFVLLGVATYETTRELCQSKIAGVMSVAGLLGCLNLICLATTPMAETTIFALITLSLLGMIRLVKDPDNNQVLKWTAVVLIVANLARYEVWAITIFSMPLMAWTFWKRSRSVSATLHKISTLYGLATIGWFFWLFMWELPIFGSPTFFVSSRYSAHALDVIEANDYSHQGHIWQSTKDYILAGWYTLPHPLLIIGGVGLGLFSIQALRHQQMVVIVLLWLAVPLSMISSLFMGGNNLRVPTGSQLGYNLRYGLLLATVVPVLAGFAAYQVSKHAKLWLGGRKGMLVSYALLVVLAIVLMAPLVHPVANASLFQEENIAYIDPGVKVLASCIKENYQGGRILMESFKGDKSYLQFYSGPDLSQFLTEYDSITWPKALANPQKYAAWVLTSNRQDDSVYQAIAADSQFGSDYTPVCTNSYGTLYKRN